MDASNLQCGLYVARAQKEVHPPITSRRIWVLILLNKDVKKFMYHILKMRSDIQVTLLCTSIKFQIRVGESAASSRTPARPVIRSGTSYKFFSEASSTRLFIARLFFFFPVVPIR